MNYRTAALSCEFPTVNPRSRIVGSTALCGFFVFALNVLVCTDLWSAGYVDHLGSVEGSFLAFSRWIAGHRGDLHWFPLWFSGMPFERVYGPNLHWTVAALSSAAHISILRSYRIVTAALYCLGPVTLFWLCRRLTGSRGYALAVSLAYSLFSPIALLSASVTADLGSLFWARRYQALVHYGEGPHIATLALLPLVVWSFHEVVGEGRRRFVPVAAVLFGVAIATNWTGTIGILMALAAYSLSRWGKVPRVRWLWAAGIGVLGYGMVCPLVPLSVLVSAPGNAEASDGTYFGLSTGMGLVGLAGALTSAHLILERLRLDRNFRFFVYLFLISGSVALGRIWFNVSLTPQAHRFQLVMEVGLVGAILYPFHIAWLRWEDQTRRAIVILFVLFCGFQWYEYRQYVRSQTRSIRIENRVEYRAAKWLEQNANGARVFAPGSIAIWMNAFADTPQMVGCCDQSVPSRSHRLAFYTIYTGENAGTKDAENSLLWLKAYGTSMVGVSAPSSAEYFKAFRNPDKFEGLLPVIWREDGVTFYRVPGVSETLAHVIPADRAVRRPPAHGLDVEHLRKYVAALEDPAAPRAEMKWVSGHESRIKSNLRSGQLLSVQVSYAPGWTAAANGRPVAVQADGLGLMVLEPPCDGACDIDLRYGPPSEHIYSRWAQIFAFAVALAVVLLPQHR
jgi:hypothetical protein